MNKLILLIAILLKLVFAKVGDICYINEDVNGKETIYCRFGYKCCYFDKCCRDFGQFYWIIIIAVVVAIIAVIAYYGYRQNWCKRCCKRSQTQTNNNQQEPLLNDRPSSQPTGFRPIQGLAISLQNNSNAQDDNNNNV
ncbi:hypothetical protein ABPG74_020377 [Tetrahymena malaccensis]